MNRLRGSASVRGTPPDGEIEPVAKWFSTSSTTSSGVARTEVIAELRWSSE